MSQKAEEMFTHMLQLMMENDLEGMMNYMHADAVLIDPHYPVECMKGKKAIRQGLTWGLKTLVKPGFKVTRFHATDNAGAVEVDTHHVLQGGMEVKFDQVFIFEVKDNHFIRIQSFVPYRQPGIGGWIPRMTGLWWKLTGKV